MAGLSGEIADFVSRMNTSANADPEHEDFSDIQCFFSVREWRGMTDVWKTRLKMLKQNYELLKMCGIHIPMPDFMLNGNRQNDQTAIPAIETDEPEVGEIPFPDYDANDEDYVPELDDDPPYANHQARFSRSKRTTRSISKRSRKQAAPVKLPTDFIKEERCSPEADWLPEHAQLSSTSAAKKPALRIVMRKRKHSPDSDFEESPEDEGPPRRRPPRKMQRAAPSNHLRATKQKKRRRKFSVAKKKQPVRKPRQRRDQVSSQCAALLDELLTEVAGPREDDDDLPLSDLQRWLGHDESGSPKDRNIEKFESLADLKAHTDTLGLSRKDSRPMAQGKTLIRYICRRKQRFNCKMTGRAVTAGTSIAFSSNGQHEHAEPDSSSENPLLSLVEGPRLRVRKRARIRYDDLENQADDDDERPRKSRSRGGRRSLPKKVSKKPPLRDVPPLTATTMEELRAACHAVDFGEEKKYACHYCGIYFLLHRMVRHLREVHNFTLDPSQRQEHDCKWCGSIFKRKEHLYRHELKVHGCTSRPPPGIENQCDVCQETLPSRRQLRQHRWLVHAIRPPALKRPTARGSSDSPSSLSDFLADRRRRQREKYKVASFASHSLALRKYYQPAERAALNRTGRQRAKMAAKCDGCVKLFRISKLNRVAKHRLVHKPNTYRCQTCGVVFKLQACRSNHVRRVHAKQQSGLKCDACSQLFATQREGRFHALECPGRVAFVNLEENGGAAGKAYYCSICAKPFGGGAALRAHRADHKADAIECQICNRKYYNQELYEKHVDSHVKIRPFACLMCERTYSKKAHLLRHCLEVHKLGVQGELVTDLPKHECRMCYCVFKRADHLKRHEKRVHSLPGPAAAVKLEGGEPRAEDAPGDGGDESWLCASCGATFASQGRLTMHERKVHNLVEKHPGQPVVFEGLDDEKLFSCNLCGHIFKCLEFLEKHTATEHTKFINGELPFLCTYCAKPFKNKLYVARHERLVHKIGDPAPGVSRVQERPFSCSLCDKAFTKPRFLAQHEFKAHGAMHVPEYSAFTCEVCGKGFLNKKVMRRHLRTAHGMLPDVVRQRTPKAATATATAIIEETARGHADEELTEEELLEDLIRNSHPPSLVRPPPLTAAYPRQRKPRAGTTSKAMKTSPDSYLNEIQCISPALSRTSAGQSVAAGRQTFSPCANSLPASLDAAATTAAQPTAAYSPNIDMRASPLDYSAQNPGGSGGQPQQLLHYPQLVARKHFHLNQAGLAPGSTGGHVLLPTHAHLQQGGQQGHPNIPGHNFNQDLNGFLNEFFLSTSQQNLQGGAYQQPNGYNYMML